MIGVQVALHAHVLLPSVKVKSRLIGVRVSGRPWYRVKAAQLTKFTSHFFSTCETSARGVIRPSVRVAAQPEVDCTWMVG